MAAPEGVRSLPKEKTGTYNHKEYQKAYQKTMKRKLVSFNPVNPEDMVLWEYMMAKGKGNVSPYIKSLIKADMEKEAQ